MSEKEMKEGKYPLMLVFYLDREMMSVPDIIQPFVESVNNALGARDANAMAFFIPTDGEEKIECINPVMIKEADMSKINEMVEDIKKNFDIGQGADKDKGSSESNVSL